jgi:hypothetical protein
MTGMNIKQLIAVPVLAAVTVGIWYGWLGWDTGYQVDSAGHQSGPYEAWQVAGCVLSLAVVGALASMRVRPWLVAAVMTVAFTVTWSVDAASKDETGLWGVGAMLVLAGMALGSGVVCYAAALTRQMIRRGAA